MLRKVNVDFIFTFPFPEGYIQAYGVNSQYALGVASLDLLYSDYMKRYKVSVACSSGSATKTYNSGDVFTFAKGQVSQGTVEH